MGTARNLLTPDWVSSVEGEQLWGLRESKAGEIRVGHEEEPMAYQWHHPETGS